jgi:hypothetical protein
VLGVGGLGRQHHGQIRRDAKVPSGWRTTPAAFTVDTRNGPGVAVVDVTVRAPETGTGGPVPVRLRARAGHVEASASTRLTAFGAWPAGTTAVASSFHAPNVYEGQTRTYDPSNAVDDDLGTFWNDDTSGQFPDTLTVTSPSAVTMRGVAFASMPDGVPTDFVVQTWDGSAWSTQAEVSGNAALTRWIPFGGPVTTTQVRVVVSADQTQNGAFTRVAELTP